MNIKEVLNSKVLDKNAYEVGTVTDFDIDQKRRNYQFHDCFFKKRSIF